MAAEIVRQLAEIVGSAVGIDSKEVAPLLGAPPREGMGDYSLPCFKLAPMLKKDPKSLATQIVESLSATDLITEATAAGPYVNIRVSAEALARSVIEGVARAAAAPVPYATSAEGEGKTVVIEYSSPNIAKPFGIGHLRSTVIGNSLVKLYGAAGYRVVRLNYPGDWGTQFGLILTAWRKWGDESRLDADGGGVSYLVELYQRASAEAKQDESLADEARAAFKRLEDGDAESLAVWQRFRDLSFKEYERVYDLIGVSFDSYDGEASTRPLISGAIEKLKKRGLLVQSEGAQVVELGMGDNVPPGMIIKSDGGTTYLARDLAALMDRYHKYGFEKCIYVVGRDQELHFRQLFRVLELMGLEWADRCVHVPFGMIRFGGEKMSTRGGSTVLLENVFTRAFEEVGSIVESRKKGVDLDAAQQKEVDRAVAMGAVIFADLSRRRIKDFDFDWQNAFSLDGDSGPYLQYAHARSGGILKKSGRELNENVDYSLLSSEAEKSLLKVLGRYPAAVGRARQEDEPSLLGAHITEICRALNFFYNNCRVLGEDRAVEDARLHLVNATKSVLSEALGMLGISAPTSM